MNCTRFVILTLLVALSQAACAPAEELDTGADAGAVSEAAASKGFDGLTTVTPGKRPGTVLVDASGGRSMFLVRDHGMHFEDAAELYAFLAEYFNGTPVLDAKGTVVAMEGEITTVGTPHYADGDHREVYAVTDVLGATLGGKSGIMTVGKDTYCVRPEVCGKTALAVGSGNELCDDGFCARGGSRIIDLPPFNPFLRIVGASTDRTAGGLQTRYFFCWNGWAPWVCSTTSGSNTLSVDANFQFDPNYPPPPGFYPPEPVTRNNVDSVNVSLWGVGAVFNPSDKLGGFCDLHTPGSQPPVACNVIDVCGEHYGRGAPGEGSVEFRTDVYDACEDFGKEE